MNVQSIKSINSQMNFTSRVVCKDEKGNKVKSDALKEFAKENSYKAPQLASALNYLENDGKSDVYKFSKTKDGGVLEVKYPDGGKFQIPVLKGLQSFVDMVIAAGKSSAKEDGDLSSFRQISGEHEHREISPKELL